MILMIEKTRITLSIPKELDNKLREFIINNHKTYKKGLISSEVQNALNLWINLTPEERADIKEQ